MNKRVQPRTKPKLHNIDANEEDCTCGFSLIRQYSQVPMILNMNSGGMILIGCCRRYSELFDIRVDTTAASYRLGSKSGFKNKIVKANCPALYRSLIFFF